MSNLNYTTMKKFYFFFVLLFGLTVMTSCEKDEEVEKTEKTEKTEKSDEERFIGTWNGEDDEEEYTFVFKADGKGSLTMEYDGGKDKEKIEWKINEKKQVLTIIYVEAGDDEEDHEYEFEDDETLWIDGILFEKQ